MTSHSELEKMASTTVQSALGGYLNVFAVAGVAAVSYVSVKLILSILNGIKVFFLSGPLGLSINLRKTGEWAVITGSTDGIGKAYAEQIAKRGMNVILISRTKEKLENVARDIESKYNVKTKIVVADFSRGPEIYPSIEQQLKGLDIGVLVNNVGLGYDYPEFYLDLPNRNQHVMDLLHVNVTSVVMMTGIVLPGMVEKKKGVVINISSASGLVPTPLLTIYSSAKAFVDFFSTGLREEYKSRGITVQCVMPYFVATKMSKMRKTSIAVPSTTNFAISALNSVGVEERTNGYWTHSIMGYIFTAIPESFCYQASLKALGGARKVALKKKAAKQD